jgi:hypothetical protein
MEFAQALMDKANAGGRDRSDGASVAPQPVRPSDPHRNGLVICHAYKGQPICAYIFNPDTKERLDVILSPQNAGQLGQLLIEAALKEMGHR